MSDTIDCWKPWLALAEEASRPTRQDLGPHLFLGSRLGGDGREIFQGDGHGNQLVAVAINDEIALRLVGATERKDLEKEVAYLIVEHLNEDMTNALEVAQIIVRRLGGSVKR